jgi:hypothetical protein
MMEVAVVKEFLACPGETGRVVAAHQAGQRFPPVDAQPLELFQERVFDKRLGHLINYRAALAYLTAAVAPLLTLGMI